VTKNGCGKQIPVKSTEHTIQSFRSLSAKDTGWDGRKKRAVGQQINRLEKKGATEEKSQCVQYFRENPTRRQKSPQWAFKKGVQMQKKAKNVKSLFSRVAFGGTSVEKRRTKYAQRSKRREKRKGTCLKGWMNKRVVITSMRGKTLKIALSRKKKR